MTSLWNNTVNGGFNLCKSLRRQEGPWWQGRHSAAIVFSPFPFCFFLKNSFSNVLFQSSVSPSRWTLQKMLNTSSCWMLKQTGLKTQFKIRSRINNLLARTKALYSSHSYFLRPLFSQHSENPASSLVSVCLSESVYVNLCHNTSNIMWSEGTEATGVLSVWRRNTMMNHCDWSVRPLVAYDTFVFLLFVY